MTNDDIIAKKVWEDGTEEEETWSNPVEGEGDMAGEYSMSLYFKYPWIRPACCPARRLTRRREYMGGEWPAPAIE